jgi:transcriptional regulator with XRE-family HTH domain
MPKRSQDVPDEYTEYERELATAIGARIRQRRLQLDLNQADLRTKMETNSVHVTRAKLSRIENGQRLPDAAALIALSTSLEVSCNWLLFGTEEPTTGAI